MSNNRKWIVSTSGDKSLSDMKKLLTEKGFAVEQVLDEIGCITGSGTEDIAEKVRGIPGITDVSQDADIDIGNPGDKETW